MSRKISLLQKARSYRRGMGIFLATVILFLTSSTVVKAETDSQECQQAKMEQEEAEIDELFDEMSKFTLQKIRMSGEGDVATIDGFSDANIQGELEKIDAELENLGVRKIDVNNPHDKAMLDEMPAFPVSGIEAQSDVYDDAPTLSAIANDYTLYIYDGEYTCDSGRTYSHRKIYVHDGVGRALWNTETFQLGPTESVGSILLKDLLSYNFKYVVSDFLGKIDSATLKFLDWTLGNVMTVLNDLLKNPGVRVELNNKLYEAIVMAQTEMRYFYVYDGGWKLIGNAATVWVDRTDVFIGLVDGNKVKDMSESPVWNSSSGIATWQYISRYDLTGRNNPYFLLSFPLGSFEVKGMDKTYTMKPRFYQYPGEI